MKGSVKRNSAIYSNWIESIIREKVVYWRNGSESCDEYLRTYGFFVTFTFDRGLLSSKKNEASRREIPCGDIEMDEMRKLYNKVLRSFLGSNYSRRLDEAPLAIFSLDAEGTRFGMRNEPLQNLHVHSIWVMRPGQVEPYLGLLELVKSAPWKSGFAFDSIDIRRISKFSDPMGGASLLTSYLTKFQGQNATRCQISNDLMIYPRLKQSAA